MKLLVRFVVLGLFGLFTHANPALGHHSHGNYSIGTEIFVEGVVTDLLLRNPHVWVFADIEDAEGNTANWGLETGGLAGFKRKGWDVISVGDEISVECTPTVDGSNGCLIIDLVIGASTGEDQSESTLWSQYTYQEDFFMVNFPSEPTLYTQEYPSEFGDTATYPSKVYESRTQDSLYSVTVVDYTEGQNLFMALGDSLKTNGVEFFWIYDQMASIAYAAQEIRSRGGETTYDAWHHVDFIDGHEVYTNNPEEGTRTYAGIYRHAGRLYILEATIPTNAPPPGIFQQSLVVIDAEGKRVRYQLDPISQSRVRIETDY